MPSRAFYQRLILGTVLLIIICSALWYCTEIEPVKSHKDELFYLAQQHLHLVASSMFLALLIGLVSGILLSRPFVGNWAESAMQIFNIANTLPPLAVLALAMIFFGIGDNPAIVALFLASLLPIVRNTYSGLKSIPPSLIEAASGLGMTAWQRLWRVELPNAIPIIFSGIRTATVINVGTAPLAFMIGASGFGELIFPGIYLDNFPLLILGASATAIIALLLDIALSMLSRLLSHHIQAN